jgi:hypothetical protein
MADEISGSHFAASDERGKTREETNCNKDAANDFDDSCEPNNEPSRTGWPPNQPKTFWPLWAKKQHAGDDPQQGERVGRKRSKSFP